MTIHTIRNSIAIISLLALLAACSSTSNLPEGETLYRGIKKTDYTSGGYDDYSVAVQEEIDVALGCAPNGAILGSSSLVTPIPIRLWIYNAYANSEKGFGKWMRKTFGSEYVLMSDVNPDIRALVAKNALRAWGYFDADVTYDISYMKNPKKAKISYHIDNGHLYTYDSIEYRGYIPAMDSLIHLSLDDSMVKTGEAFSTTSLDGERDRLATLFKNHGYYYYKSTYTGILADSVSHPGTVDIRFQPTEDVPYEANHPWYLGKLKIVMKKNVMSQITDTIDHRFLSVYYSGDKPPIRLKALLKDMKLRPRDRYSYDRYTESASVLNSLGIFSSTTFDFTPRDTTETCDTLDMTLTCVFDKPYDGSIEANYSLKSNDRMGPGLQLSVTKKNAFRGAEKLSLTLMGSYEWQTGNRVASESSSINSYEYGAEVSIEYPRIEAPFSLFEKKRFYKPPSTTVSLSGNVLNRADYFKMYTISLGITYTFRTSPRSKHEFSPFILDYNLMGSTTAKFDSIMTNNPAVYISMKDQFSPKIKYTYQYTSPSTYKHPIAWEISLTESGNILSLFYAAAGKGFNEKDKHLFGNPFAQFLKVNTTLKKTWTVGYKSQLVGRIVAGVLWAYGNSEQAPYSEQFYVGGANSIRAFTVRSIGPGKYVSPTSNYAYLDQTGDVKFEANLEYRFNLFGSLYGALFLDAGNIWLLKEDESRADSKFKFGSCLRQLATGTGAGIRYDMDFLVIRLDLGVALHVPYETGKGGYYNIPKFSDGLGLHFAIGYPF